MRLGSDIGWLVSAPLLLSRARVRIRGHGLIYCRARRDECGSLKWPLNNEHAEGGWMYLASHVVWTSGVG